MLQSDNHQPSDCLFLHESCFKLHVWSMYSTCSTLATYHLNTCKHEMLGHVLDSDTSAALDIQSSMVPINVAMPAFFFFHINPDFTMVH